MADFAYYDPSDPSVIYVTQPPVGSATVVPKPQPAPQVPMGVPFGSPAPFGAPPMP